ncbi:hypothetical protein WJX74_008954 [Apatococcus lobatus]|uniref:Uncharacterized protein n=1 Tax=Apatococcus lobatus TaxID=904363 RepID=A0AAW1RCG9_9CHLO
MERYGQGESISCLAAPAPGYQASSLTSNSKSEMQPSFVKMPLQAKAAVMLRATSSGKRAPRCPESRRIHKLLQNIWDLFGAIEGLASHKAISIMLVLGQTVARPKETYHLTGILSSATDPRPGNGQDLVRRALRALVNAAAEMPEGSASAGPTKMFLLVEMNASERTPSGFLPLNNRTMNLKKALQVKISLQAPIWREPSSEVMGDQQMEQQMSLVTTGVWYLCKKHVKGIRGAASPCVSDNCQS